MKRQLFYFLFFAGPPRTCERQALRWGAVLLFMGGVGRAWTPLTLQGGMGLGCLATVTRHFLLRAGLRGCRGAGDSTKETAQVAQRVPTLQGALACLSAHPPPTHTHTRHNKQSAPTNPVWNQTQITCPHWTAASNIAIRRHLTGSCKGRKWCVTFRPPYQHPWETH